VALKRISVLVNPAAGGDRGLARTKDLVAELADRGWTVDLLKASAAEEVAATVSTAAQAGMKRLVLAGGDGLVHRALPALVGSDITVGIVPVGTGNDFCRGLGLPTNRAAALEAATGPDSFPVDVIAVRHPGGVSYAATVVTAGFSGRVNKRADELAARRGVPKGSSRYTLATVVELAALEPRTFRLTSDGGNERDIEASLIAIGNTRYFGGGMAVCPNAVFNDGAMDLVVIDPVSKVTFAWVLPFVFSGRHIRHRAVSTQRCRSLTVTTTEPMWADGEQLDLVPVGESEALITVELSVEANALRVAGVPD